MLMLRGMDEDVKKNSEYKQYLSLEASCTIALLMDEVQTFGCGYTADYLYYDVFGEEFFDGIGKGYNMPDGEAGREIIVKTMESIEAKMVDLDKCYQLNLLERFLLHKMAKLWNPASRKEYPYYWAYSDIRNEQMDCNLKVKYKKDPLTAAFIAEQYIYVYKMVLDEYAPGNDFFWSTEHFTIFKRGFCNALFFLVSAIGQATGYGYDYTYQMFDDIGVEFPLQLIGTKEANKIRVQEQIKRMKGENHE